MNDAETEANGHPGPAQYQPLLDRLRAEGGVLSGPDGEADRLFGPVAVRMAERDGLVVRNYSRNWGMGEEIRLTGRGRRLVGLAPLPLLQRLMQALRRPPAES